MAVGECSKVCTKCGIDKPFSEYTKAAKGKFGLDSRCRACLKAYWEANREARLVQKRAYNAANRDKIKAWEEANRDRRKAYREVYYAANRERYLAHAKRYRETDPRGKKAMDAEHHAKHKERRNAQSRAYRQANREQVRAYNQSYSAANRLLFRAHDAKRKARKLKAGGAYTPADVERLLKLQRCMCAICRDSLKKGFHVDHIKPLARGGSNGPENIQLLCQPCNQRKHARDPVEHMQSLGFLL